MRGFWRGRARQLYSRLSPNAKSSQPQQAIHFNSKAYCAPTAEGCDLYAHGAEGGTRTRTARATAPSRRRVYQFHHFGIVGPRHPNHYLRAIAD